MSAFVFQNGLDELKQQNHAISKCNDHSSFRTINTALQRSTVVEENIGTLAIGERCFLDLHHLSKSIQLQMIPHLKALI